LWSLEYGQYADALESIAAKGRKVTALKKRPVLFEDLNEVWDAFIQLHRSRAVGFTQNPISVRDITAILDLYEVRDYEARTEWCELIMAMDAAYFGWKNKQVKDGNNRRA